MYMGYAESAQAHHAKQMTLISESKKVLDEKARRRRELEREMGPQETTFQKLNRRALELWTVGTIFVSTFSLPFFPFLFWGQRIKAKKPPVNFFLSDGLSPSHVPSSYSLLRCLCRPTREARGESQKRIASLPHFRYHQMGAEGGRDDRGKIGAT